MITFLQKKKSITNEKSISHFNVRILPENMSQTISAIEKGFKQVLPEYEFSFQFYDGSP